MSADKTVYEEPSDVSADGGIIRVKGPDAVDVRMTPDAAEETSGRLMQNVLKARGQRYLSGEDSD
jgi:hypothetical protein